LLSCKAKSIRRRKFELVSCLPGREL
jgi:hypothetical protein